MSFRKHRWRNIPTKLAFGPEWCVMCDDVIENGQLAFLDDAIRTLDPSYWKHARCPRKTVTIEKVKLFRVMEGKDEKFSTTDKSAAEAFASALRRA